MSERVPGQAGRSAQAREHELECIIPPPSPSKRREHSGRQPRPRRIPESRQPRQVRVGPVKAGDWVALLQGGRARRSGGKIRGGKDTSQSSAPQLKSLFAISFPWAAVGGRSARGICSCLLLHTAIRFPPLGKPPISRPLGRVTWRGRDLWGPGAACRAPRTQRARMAGGAHTAWTARGRSTCFGKADPDRDGSHRHCDETCHPRHRPLRLHPPLL